ncbi:MAG: penicillin-binding protein activator [Pseudomonadota bacterium]
MGERWNSTGPRRASRASVATQTALPRAAPFARTLLSLRGTTGGAAALRAMFVAATALTLSGCAMNLFGATQTASIRTDAAPAANQPTPTQAAFGDAAADPTRLVPTPRATRPRPVRIGLLLPLSGGGERLDKFAAAMRQAAELALFDRNAPHVQLIIKDTRGDPDAARAAAMSAIQDGAQILIGPVYPRAVDAVAEIARQGNLPVIAFASGINAQHDHVHLLSYRTGETVPRLIAYARARGQKRFAAMLPDTGYGGQIEQVFRRAVRQAGGEVAGIIRYPLEPNGLVGPVDDLKAMLSAHASRGAPIQAVFMPGDSETLPRLSALLGAGSGQDAIASVKWLGTGSWDHVGIERNAVLQAGWFASTDPVGWQAFSQRFAASYRVVPPRIATLAYDAVALAASLGTAAGGPQFTSAALRRPTGFAGVSGVFRFTADGHTQRTYGVFEVRNPRPVAIDPAPQVFAPRGQQQLQPQIGPRPPLAQARLTQP